MGWAFLSTTVRPLSEADLDQVSEIFAWYACNAVATFADVRRSDQEWRELRAALADRDLPFLVAEGGGGNRRVCLCRPVAVQAGLPAYG